MGVAAARVSQHELTCWVAYKLRGSTATAGVLQNPGPTIAAANMLTTLGVRSEEHTSELQSQSNLVCRLLLEKKNTTAHSITPTDLSIAQRHRSHTVTLAH